MLIVASLVPAFSEGLSTPMSMGAEVARRMVTSIPNSEYSPQNQRPVSWFCFFDSALTSRPVGGVSGVTVPPGSNVDRPRHEYPVYTRAFPEVAITELRSLHVIFV